MSISDFEKIKGFYYEIGSQDYNKSHSPFEKFGFNTGVNLPIFETTISKVNDIFKKPISTFANANGNFGNLIYSVDSTTFKQSDWATAFDQAMLIISLLYKYQFNSDVNNDGTPETNIVNYVNTNSTTWSYYVKDTLQVVLDDTMGAGRIKKIMFKLDLDVTDTLDPVMFEIFFNPDELLSDEYINRIEVYLYTDNDAFETPGWDTISKGEWEDKISQKHIDIFGNARYDHKTSYVVKYYPLRKSINSAKFYDHIFFLYSLEDISTNTNIILDEIRKFVLAAYNNDFNLAIDHYPDLFTNKDVQILAVYTPNVTNKVPYNVKDITDILVRNGVNSTDNNFKNAEMLPIYRPNLTDVSTMAIAYNVAIADQTRPISVVLSNAYNMYSDIDAKAFSACNASEKFYKLLKIAVDKVTKDVTIPTTLVENQVTYVSSTNIVTFNFNSVKFIVSKGV